MALQESLILDEESSHGRLNVPFGSRRYTLDSGKRVRLFKKNPIRQTTGDGQKALVNGAVNQMEEKQTPVPDGVLVKRRLMPPSPR